MEQSLTDELLIRLSKTIPRPEVRSQDSTSAIPSKCIHIHHTVSPGEVQHPTAASVTPPTHMHVPPHFRRSVRPHEITRCRDHPTQGRTMVSPPVAAGPEKP